MGVTVVANMVSFDEILHKQRALMNSVTNTITNVKKLGQAKMTHAVLRARLETMKERFEECRLLDAKLRLTADPKTIDVHPYVSDLEFAKCESAFDTAVDYLYEQLEDSAPSPGASSANVSRSLKFPSHTALNLPKVTLPTFDGSYDKWKSFRDQFYSMIINEPSLSNVQKLHHLFSCLKGEALR